MGIKQKSSLKLNKRLKGYHKHFRGRFLLLKVLKPEEYILWDISFSLAADWDKKHETYGTFSFTFADISYFAQRDPSTVSRSSKKLFSLGLWKKRDDGSIEVCGFNVIEHLATLTKELGIIDLQSYIANQQFNHASTNDNLVDLQQNPVKEIDNFPPQTDANMHDEEIKTPLISSKGNSNVLIKKVIVNSIRTEEEYQRMYKDNGYKGFTPQEMKDLDESLSEPLEVTDENEQWIVETYFKGNWEEYRKNTYMGKKKSYE